MSERSWEKGGYRPTEAGPVDPTPPNVGSGARESLADTEDRRGRAMELAIDYHARVRRHAAGSPVTDEAAVIGTAFMFERWLRLGYPDCLRPDRAE